jgi:putative ATP-binding cassette transporter
MRFLALLIAGLSLAAAAQSQWLPTGGAPIYLAMTGLVVALLTLRAGALGPFLRFFSLFYALSFALLLALTMAAPYLPAGLSRLVPPSLTAYTAGAFVVAISAMARIPVVCNVVAIADPYFATEDRRPLHLPGFGPLLLAERKVAMTLLAGLILINLGQVAISVQLSHWGRNWFDAIQAKNAAEFWRLIYGEWVIWVIILISSNLLEFILENVFKVRWRNWMTDRLLGRWLSDGTHYRLTLIGSGVDNPDQRIQEDINKYIGAMPTGSTSIYGLSISLIQQISSLISFAAILWGLSANLTVPGTDTQIPGLLLWIALLYAAIGTLVAHLLGRRLIPLYFAQEKYEANFRFGLARLREFSEPVALLGGETTERRRLGSLFGELVENFFRIVHVRKWLNAFTQFYGSSNSVVPYVIVAPFYFADKVTLGVMNQTAGAFARVDGALSFFIDRYASLADFKAVVDRLNSFEASVNRALDLAATSAIRQARAEGRDLTVPELDLALPDGRRIAEIRDLTLRAGDHTLITGPSGSGKSTLFRALSGIWPFGRGRMHLPEASVMVLPQRPYLPIGTLRSAVSYPDMKGTYPDEAILKALDAVSLGQLKGRLDEEAHWTSVLSGGEQQRLAIARAILARPAWLLMDESTSALDEPLEKSIYAALRTLLPDTTVVSIGHRSSLIPYHDARIAMERRADGLFEPVAVKSQ